MGVVIILTLIFIGLLIFIRNSDKRDENFADRPLIINNPEKDLLINQKYAIVKLLAFVQGASPLSAYSDEADKIVQSIISSLGLSKWDVSKIIRISMSHNPEREIEQIFYSLKEIRDRRYLLDLYNICMAIARISKEKDVMIVLEHMFHDLGVR